VKVATSSAAELDNPEPRGTELATTASKDDIAPDTENTRTFQYNFGYDIKPQEVDLYNFLWNSWTMENDYHLIIQLCPIKKCLRPILEVNESIYTYIACNYMYVIGLGMYLMWREKYDEKKKKWVKHQEVSA
jgi:DUF2075 family protein